jgi:hypothetical protein
LYEKQDWPHNLWNATDTLTKAVPTTIKMALQLTLYYHSQPASHLVHSVHSLALELMLPWIPLQS